MTVASRKHGVGTGHPEVRFRVDRDVFNRMVEEAREKQIPLGSLVRAIVQDAYRPAEIDVEKAVRYLTESGFDVLLKDRRAT